MVTVKEAADEGHHGEAQSCQLSRCGAKAMPSVVNVFTSKEVKVSPHPLMEDPLFRRFFGDRFECRRAGARRVSGPA